MLNRQHIIRNNSLTGNIKSRENKRRSHTRAVLARRTVKHRSTLIVVDNMAHKTAKSRNHRRSTFAVRIDHQIMGSLSTHLPIKQKLPKARNIANRHLVIIDKLRTNSSTRILGLLLLATKIVNLADTNRFQGIQIALSQVRQMTTTHNLAPLNRATLRINVTANIAKVNTTV